MSKYLKNKKLFTICSLLIFLIVSNVSLLALADKEEDFYKNIKYDINMDSKDFKIDSYPNITAPFNIIDENKRPIPVSKEQNKDIFYLKEDGKNISDFKIEHLPTSSSIISVSYLIDSSELMASNIDSVKTTIKSFHKNLYPNDFVSIIDVNSKFNISMEPKAAKNIDIDKELEKIKIAPPSQTKPLYNGIMRALVLAEKLKDAKKVVMVFSNGVNFPETTKLGDIVGKATKEHIQIHSAYFESKNSFSNNLDELSRKTSGFFTNMNGKIPKDIGKAFYTEKIVPEIKSTYSIKFKSNFVFSDTEYINLVYLKLNSLFKFKPTKRNLTLTSIIDGKDNKKEISKEFIVPAKFIDKDLPIWFKIVMIVFLLGILAIIYMIMVKPKKPQSSNNTRNNNIVPPTPYNQENNDDETELGDKNKKTTPKKLDDDDNDETELGDKNKKTTPKKPDDDDDDTIFTEPVYDKNNPRHSNKKKNENNINMKDDDDDDDKTVLAKLRRNKAFLVIKSGPLKNKLFSLEGKTIIGRKKDSNISIPDQGISGTHCKISFDSSNKTYSIENISDSNYIEVNSQETLKANLKDGDEIVLGNTTLIFKIAKIEK